MSNLDLNSGHGDSEISYTDTRVIPLDSEYLIKNRIVSYNKLDQVSKGFDILRTQIINKMLENGWRTIAITSPIQGCGKSMVSINLAMSIAHHTNRTALLVDFDLRQPSISKYLGLPTDISLNEVITNEATISEALVNPGLERLVILPISKPVINSSEVLSSRKVFHLIGELRDRYAERIVIFDMPPILGGDDVLTMMPQVDCVLVVVGDGMVSKSQLTESMRHIDPGKVLGTVLNKVETPSSNQAFYD